MKTNRRADAKAGSATQETQATITDSYQPPGMLLDPSLAARAVGMDQEQMLQLAEVLEGWAYQLRRFVRACASS